MPIHDLGYRRWTGDVLPSWWKSITIARGGIQVVLRNKWVRRVLLAAWLPTIIFGVFFFSFEQYVRLVLENPGAQIAQDTMIAEMTEETPEFAIISRGLNAEDLGEGRHLIWSWLLSTFLRIPQAIMTLLVVGMIAPPLISRDIRSRAFLLYFSRPLNRYEYVLGKGLVIAAFLAFITMVPALGCYLFGLALSSDPVAILHTWDLPFRVILASLIFIIPAVSVSLMFSSLTAESRFAAFAWFATWGLGAIAWMVIFQAMIVGANQRVDAEFRERPLTREELLEGLPPNVRQQIEEKLENLPADGEAINQIFLPADAVQYYDLPNLEQNPSEQQIEEDEPIPPGAPPRRRRGSNNGQVYKDQFDRRFRIEGDQIQFINPLDHFREQARRKRMLEEQERIRNHPLSLLSMYDTLVRLQRWVFGLESDTRRILPAAAMTCFVTAISWIILLRRVSAPIRV